MILNRPMKMNNINLRCYKTSNTLKNCFNIVFILHSFPVFTVGYSQEPEFCKQYDNNIYYQI